MAPTLWKCSPVLVWAKSRLGSRISYLGWQLLGSCRPSWASKGKNMCDKTVCQLPGTTDTG
eukprot:2778880-Prorocentrum_lima.AAC.1